MIGYLKGRLLRVSPERVVLDVQGVGYAVSIPLSTFYEIERRRAEGTVGLHIHTHLREDEIALYGFWTEQEMYLFEKLIAVGGIGPRLARVILSGIPPEELVAALEVGDVARLTSIPGVGRKTAERMVLELRDRVRKLVVDRFEPASPTDQDVISALVNLGYKASQAERAVVAARNAKPEAAFPELLRLSLSQLARV